VLSIDGINWLEMMLINRVSTDLRKYWKEDEKLRWTSSWTIIRQVPLVTSTSSETDVATPGKLRSKFVAI